MHVIIIGGGIAGLAAAATLAKADIPCTILEAGSQLGGRARSVAVEFNSKVVQLDNGQHILLGAYQATLKLLADIGVNEHDAFMRLPLTLELLTQHGDIAFKFSAVRYLPFPVNQLFGFLTCKGLNFKERLSVVKLVNRLKKSRYQISHDQPLLDFLLKQQQSQKVIKLLWEPLCLSALNTPIISASSKVFLNVLHDAFEQKNSNSDMLLPKRDLSQIFAQPIARFLKAKNSNVLLNHRVKSIQALDQGYEVHTANQKALVASHVIIATSPARFKNVMADFPKLSATAELTKSFSYQPIYTIYLQYPSHIKLSKPMIGFTGMLSQWVFDRGQMCEQHGLLAVIISAEGYHQQYTHEQLALNIAQELSSVFPHLPKPLWHQVIAEKRATFNCSSNLARPTNSTIYPTLYIAGDYTYADYPATIEGAVRSGTNAATLIIKT